MRKRPPGGKLIDLERRTLHAGGGTPVEWIKAPQRLRGGPWASLRGISRAMPVAMARAALPAPSPHIASWTLWRHPAEPNPRTSPKKVDPMLGPEAPKELEITLGSWLARPSSCYVLVLWSAGGAGTPKLELPKGQGLRATACLPQLCMSLGKWRPPWLALASHDSAAQSLPWAERK